MRTPNSCLNLQSSKMTSIAITLIYTIMRKHERTKKKELETKIDPHLYVISLLGKHQIVPFK